MVYKIDYNGHVSTDSIKHHRSTKSNCMFGSVFVVAMLSNLNTPLQYHRNSNNSAELLGITQVFDCTINFIFTKFNPSKGLPVDCIACFVQLFHRPFFSNGFTRKSFRDIPGIYRRHSIKFAFCMFYLLSYS